jgi:N-acetylglucosaminyl-diphospho-decaprenol L-rhamnosyltransferase
MLDGVQLARDAEHSGPTTISRDDEAPIAVSIVVLNHNGRAWLERCLAATVAELAPDCELIVVDNGSNDGSVDFVAYAFPTIRRVVLEHNLGFAEGNNIGAKAARGRYLAFLNNDAAPSPGWLAALRNALDRDATLGLASSLIVFMHDPSTVDSAGDGLTRWGGAFKHAHGCPVGEVSGAADVFGACGAAFLVRRSLFEQAGGFDKAFFAVYEDVDLSYRFQLSGSRCRFVPEAVVHHAGSATLGRLSDQSVFWGQRNLEWMYLKNTPWPLLLLTLPGHVLYDVAAAVHFTRMGMFRTFAHAKWAAACELPRVWRQRRQIQRKRQTSWIQLWRLMDRRWIAIKLREKRFDRSIARKA